MTNNTDEEDDFAAFQEAMQGVTPLKKSKKITPPPTPHQKPVSIKKHKLHQPEADAIVYLSDRYPTTVGAESMLKFHRPSLPHSLLKKLRKGQFTMQATLDLHGYSITDAKTTLCHFLNQQCLLGHRYILVIHGKGSAKGEAPILKNLVNYWLTQLPEVLAFCSALPHQGGSGALYVWLRNTLKISS